MRAIQFKPDDESNGVGDQNHRIDRRQIDRELTLDAMQALEAALDDAAPGREQAWQESVVSSLSVLARATASEAANAIAPDSLLSDLANTQPRLRNRVRGLRLQYLQLQDAINSLFRELDEPNEAVDSADIRQRIAVLLAGLRYQRARESDLIYEAYYDAFASDLPKDASDELRGE